MTTEKTTQLATTQSTELAGLTIDQVAVVKNTICSGYTDTEMRLFLYECQRLGLDPLAREAYTFKAGGKVIIGVGIDGFRKRANDTGCYMPGRPTEYEWSGNQLIMSRVYVKRLVAGEWHEFSEDAFYDEFKGPNPNWKNMPRVMLSKCAEARALRRAFPRELGGLYVPEERDAIERNSRPPKPRSPYDPPVAPPVDVVAEVVEEPKAEPESKQPEPEPEVKLTPKESVWKVAQELGIDGAGVKAAIAKTGVPTNSAKWDSKAGAKVIAELIAMKKATSESSPEPSLDWIELQRLAKEAGATEVKLAAAIAAQGYAELDPSEYTRDHADAVLGQLEQDMGA